MHKEMVSRLEKSVETPDYIVVYVHLMRRNCPPQRMCVGVGEMARPVGQFLCPNLEVPGYGSEPE